MISSINSKSPTLLLSNIVFAWGSSTDSFGFTINHFEVGRGESNILVGRSGAGKSTLLGIVCGTLKPQRGKTIVLGQNFGEIGGRARDRFRADHIGIIFQQFNLLPYLSAIDNVLLPLNFSISRKHACGLTKAKCYAEAERLLDSLEIDTKTVAKQKAVELSIGQQQRVAAARAFIGSPELIIADEPTSSLDEEVQFKFMDQLFSQQKETGSTLLMVSHNPRIAERFNSITQLDQLITKNKEED